MDESSSGFDWKAFSRKTWVIVVSGIVVPPVGIVLAWLKPDWSPKAKWIATGLMGLVLVGRMTGSPESDSPSADAESQVNSETVLAALPTGLTPPGGAKVGPAFDRKELSEIAGRIIQSGIRPGWDLERVLAVLGKPTRFMRINGFTGQTPETQKKVLDDPLVPPDVKQQMLKELVICTWSYTKDPGSYFITLGFNDGVLDGDDESITINLPK